jgi:hypothetical protein
MLVSPWSPGSPQVTIDGFNLVVDVLKLNGIETIYGAVGIPITDLARIPQAKSIRYSEFRQEQAAGHAAVAAKEQRHCRASPADAHLGEDDRLAAFTEGKIDRPGNARRSFSSETTE